MKLTIEQTNSRVDVNIDYSEILSLDIRTVLNSPDIETKFRDALKAYVLYMIEKVIADAKMIVRVHPEPNQPVIDTEKLIEAK